MLAVVSLVLVLTAPQTPYDTVFDQLKNLAPVASAVAPVHGLVLHRDVLELRLDDGFAFKLSPVAGRTAGIAFVGSGSMSFTPPLVVEQFNLRRVMGGGDSTISGPISAAVFIFADSTEAELGRKLKFGAAPQNAPDPSGAIGEALDYIVDGHSHSADASLITALLNGTTTGYFTGYIKRQKGEGVMVQYDPALAEQVLLLRRGKMVGQRTETVCQFQSAADLAHGISVADEQPEALLAANYDIDASIDNNYKFAARVNERLVARRDKQQWADFLLYSELHVDSLATKDGTGLTFYRKDNEPELWVRFPKPLAAGDTIDLRFVYHGNLIGFGSALDDILPPWFNGPDRQIATMMDSWAYIKSVSTWFPRYSLDQSVPVSLTFHTPKNLKFATIGRLADSSTQGNVLTTHWVSELPANQIAFNIGRFDQLDIKDPRIPPVTVHVNTEAHGAIRRFIPSARNPADFVGSDVANSLSFFTQMYGPPLFHQYTATEIPYFHGLAFPGMIQLSWATFLSLSDNGHDEIFRAHEMAHQWWGIGVEPAGYRDWWLAEGFSEFSGMWYMQMILHDNDKYFKSLKDSREEIRRERTKAAPLGIGTRAAESWRGSYQLITYEKGAWVLHMLRNMLLDTRTMSEDRFIATMKDFYTTYRGKRATTNDFQKIVERHVGQPMDWFFNEWIYGTSVPTYTFSWTTEPDSTGQGVAARLRVRQSDVPDGFMMYVPVLITFEQGEAVVRIKVSGPNSEARIRLPTEPKALQLNPFESVLAEVKTEAWHQ